MFVCSVSVPSFCCFWRCHPSIHFSTFLEDVLFTLILYYYADISLVPRPCERGKTRPGIYGLHMRVLRPWTYRKRFRKSRRLNGMNMRAKNADFTCYRVEMASSTHTVCRYCACAVQTKHYTALFSLNKHLPARMAKLCEVPISEHDDPPQYICRVCLR